MVRRKRKGGKSKFWCGSGSDDEKGGRTGDASSLDIVRVPEPLDRAKNRANA